MFLAGVAQALPLAVIDLAASWIHEHALWRNGHINVNVRKRERLRHTGNGYPSGLHGLEHAAISMFSRLLRYYRAVDDGLRKQVTCGNCMSINEGLFEERKS